MTWPKGKIAEIWDQVAPMVEAGIGDTFGYSVEDVRDKLERGEAQLWASCHGGEVEAVCITSVEIVPQGKFCLIWIVAGRIMNSWIGFIDEIEDWARDIGCHEVQICGRRGWLKMLPDYAEQYTVISKVI